MSKTNNIKLNHIDILKKENQYFVGYAKNYKSNLFESLKSNQIDLNDFHIIKSTNMQRIINIDEFYNFKYSCYLLVKKTEYKLSQLNEILLFLNKLNIRYLKFLNIKSINQLNIKILNPIT
jgi:hypothetical protein